MKLPRRVPWASLAEFDEVCLWIYTDEHDLEAKIRAINRISAWSAITLLPSSLQAAQYLLTAIVQDASSPNPTSFLSIRQVYATAIIRFVNGLADSLQIGARARPIASIVAQIGLPGWFVELRHEATHNDLPSLEVLRESARRALSWLLEKYFIPTLNPSSEPVSQLPPLRPLSPLLRKYKELSKKLAQDASRETKLDPDLHNLLRDIDGWISEAHVHAKISTDTVGWERDDGDGDVAREKWVLKLLCDQLMEKGHLIPRAKRKRVPADDKFIPSEPQVKLWSLLILYLHDSHKLFPAILVSRIVKHLTWDDNSSDDNRGAESIPLDSGRDLSYDTCLACWANWLLQEYGELGSPPAGQDGDDVFSRAGVALSIISKLNLSEAGGSKRIAHRLLRELCEGYTPLERARSVVQSSAQTNDPEWRDDDLAIMSKRLEKVKMQQHIPSEHDPSESQSPPAPEPVGGPELPRGWRKLTEQSGWRPTPIGVIHGA